MPELPEVETIRRDLTPLLTGRRITGLRVLPGGERLLQGAPAEALAMGLVGRRITSVGRRGKYLLLHLDDGLLLVIHLRMTGSLRHRRPDDAADPYLRAVVSLNDGCELRFTDIRKFGTFALVDHVYKAMRAPLGPEPLTDAFTVETMWERLRGRRAPLKSALLDQRVLAGVGNIYADEALFVARLHPRVPAGSLRPAERVALHAAIEQVLRDGIENRGTSFRDYTTPTGRSATSRTTYASSVARTPPATSAAHPFAAPWSADGRRTGALRASPSGRRDAACARSGGGRRVGAGASGAVDWSGVAWETSPPAPLHRGAMERGAGAARRALAPGAITGPPTRLIPCRSGAAEALPPAKG